MCEPAAQSDQASCFSFGNPRQLRKFSDLASRAGWGPDTNSVDKIAGLREILALDPGNSFARYGIAMEFAGRGETAAALEEFNALLNNDPEYTAGYFMAAQTLAGAGRKAEAAERLKAGIACAARGGNNHALSEMQGMLEELDE
jgi:predicted Zn-dependent protease